MSSAARLTKIVAALEDEGLSCLVMGGHAVRYYGLERNTIDFDLHLAPEAWDDLPAHLDKIGSTIAATPLIEGPSWRPDAFRRFQIGQLPDGREEWLEFWKANHLLPPYKELYARREVGDYGGRLLPFLSLPDLIRSKETERQRDWQDIVILEEFLDARRLAQMNAGTLEVSAALAQLRSRRGFESYLQQGHLHDPNAVSQALQNTQLSITQAYLLPCASAETELADALVPIEPVIVNRLRTVQPASPLHLTLVEAVRRQYKLAMQEADRADKQAIRQAQKNKLS